MAGIEAMEDFYRSIDMPVSISELGVTVTDEQIEELAEKSGATVIDVSVGCMVLELTGEPEKIDKFLLKLKDFEIIEMCRTGVTAMERGEVTYLLGV